MPVAALLLAILMLAACSITPEQRELIERTWAERERERAQECARIRCGQSVGSTRSPTLMVDSAITAASLPRHRRLRDVGGTRRVRSPSRAAF